VGSKAEALSSHESLRLQDWQDDIPADIAPKVKHVIVHPIFTSKPLTWDRILGGVKDLAPILGVFDSPDESN